MHCTHIALRRRAPDGACPVCPPPQSQLTDELLGLTREQIVSEDQRRKAKRYRASFFEFSAAAWDIVDSGARFAPNWHHKVFCRHLQYLFVAWRKRKLDPTYEPSWQNFITNVEPGSAKSRFYSVFFNAWTWLWDPTLSVAAFSSNPQVAVRDGGLTLDLIQSRWYQQTFAPGWKVSPQQNAKTWFALAPRQDTIAGTWGRTKAQARLGSRTSAGITAAVVGGRADILLFDDPQDPFKIFSSTYREQTNERHDKALFNRVNDLNVSCRIYVMQRLDREDLTAHLLETLPEKSRVHLSIEGIYEQGAETPIWKDTRQPGDVMHPARDGDTEKLRREIARLGVQGMAQIQQRPGARSAGSVFNVDHFVELSRPQLPAAFDRVIVSVDATGRSTVTDDVAKEAKRSNAGIVVVGVVGPRRYVIADLTPQTPPPYEVLRAIVQVAIEKHHPTDVLIEAKALGPALCSNLQAALRDKECTIHEIMPKDSKEHRWALLASAASNVGAWSILAEYAHLIKAELANAGTKARNDRADALAQIEVWLANAGTNWADAYK